MIEAVVFDIDNTLTSDVSWLRSTEMMGADPEIHRNIFDRFLRDEIPYIEAKKRLIGLWQATSNATQEYWQSMFADWPLKPDAAQLVQHTQNIGYQTAIITGSYDLFAAAIAKQLHIPHWYANTITHWDENGSLLDFDYVRDQAARKQQQLEQFCQATGIALDQCVTIGDGDNDVEIFRSSGHGIAVATENPNLLEVARHTVQDLHEIIPILDEYHEQA
jgi:phosphoserine phosphatase